MVTTDILSPNSVALHHILHNLDIPDLAKIGQLSHAFKSRFNDDYWRARLQTKFNVKVRHQPRIWSLHLERLSNKLLHAANDNEMRLCISPRHEPITMYDIPMDDGTMSECDSQSPIDLLRLVLIDNEMGVGRYLITYLMQRNVAPIDGHSKDPIENYIAFILKLVLYHLAYYKCHELIDLALDTRFWTRKSNEVSECEMGYMLEGFISGGHLTQVDRILEHWNGIDFTSYIVDGIKFAAWRGYADIVRYLLARLPDRIIPSVIQFAARGNQTSLMLEYLNKHHQHLDVALCGAVEGRNLTLFRELLDVDFFDPSSLSERILELINEHDPIDFIREVLPYVHLISIDALREVFWCIISHDDVEMYREVRRRLAKRRYVNIRAMLDVAIEVESFKIAHEVLNDYSYAIEHGNIDQYPDAESEIDNTIIHSVRQGNEDILTELLKITKHEPRWLEPIINEDDYMFFPGEEEHFSPVLFKRTDDPDDYERTRDEVDGIFKQALKRKNHTIVYRMIEKFGDRIMDWIFLEAIEANNEEFTRWGIKQQAKIDICFAHFQHRADCVTTLMRCHKELQPETYPLLVRGLKGLGARVD